MNKLKRQSIPSNAGNVRAEDKLVLKALDMMDRDLHAQALVILDRLTAKKPGHFLATLNAGVCLSKEGRLSEAAKKFYSAHQIAPDNLDVLQLCGESHLAAGHFNLAIEFFKRCVKRKPTEVSNWTNLSVAAGKSGQLTEAVMYATQALSLAPLEVASYINLGTTLLSLSRLDEAEQAYETALAIDPTNLIASGNLATVFDKRGDYFKAIECYDITYSRLNANSQDAKELLYRSSFPHLAVGNLREGWQRYDYGFFPDDVTSRCPKRKFSVPQWTGEQLSVERLLIWGEQGLGDELWFFGLLNEAKALCPNITVECQPRLVSLLQRSFPDITVRATDLKQMTAIQDYDFHIPAGSLMGIFRNHIDDLKKFQPYIKPDPNIAADFASRLQPFKGKKLVGICWRSGKVDAQRSKNYLPLAAFEQILKLDNCVIVKLQYGECEPEVVCLERELGVRVLRWSDVDLMNNQEQVAALVSQLDVVVSAGTAVAEMTAAVGTKLIRFGRGGGWRFLGQKNFPWTTQDDYVAPQQGDALIGVVPAIKKLLSD
jgi:tetratricopeptide (TPR) repeat protein